LAIIGSKLLGDPCCAPKEKLADKSEEERKAYWEEQQRLKALQGVAHVAD
jgi:hypothetical protein